MCYTDSFDNSLWEVCISKASEPPSVIMHMVYDSLDHIFCVNIILIQHLCLVQWHVGFKMHENMTDMQYSINRICKYTVKLK